MQCNDAFIITLEKYHLDITFSHCVLCHINDIYTICRFHTFFVPNYSIEKRIIMDLPTHICWPWYHYLSFFNLHIYSFRV